MKQRGSRKGDPGHALHIPVQARETPNHNSGRHGANSRGPRLYTPDAG